MSINAEKIIENIKTKMSKENFIDELDQRILDYADYEQMEDEGISDEYEYYDNYCTDEAQDDILQSLIEKEYSNLELNDYMKIYEPLKKYYWGD